jgi:hypothetical protein
MLLAHCACRLPGAVRPAGRTHTVQDVGVTQRVLCVPRTTPCRAHMSTLHAVPSQAGGCLVRRGEREQRTTSARQRREW